MRKPSKLSAANLALLAQPFDWDFMSMQKVSQPASQPASKRAESAPEARVVSVALRGGPRPLPSRSGSSLCTSGVRRGLPPSWLPLVTTRVRCLRPQRELSKV